MVAPLARGALLGQLRTVIRGRFGDWYEGIIRSTTLARLENDSGALMAIKRTPLTAQQFEFLRTREDWSIDEVPLEHWSGIPGLQRLDDTFAVFASGTVSNPVSLNGISNAVAGVDVLVAEPDPKSPKSTH